MNRLQLAQRVHLLTGAGDGPPAGSKPSTTIGQTGELGRMVVGVDEAWRAIQTARRDWLFMLREGTFPLLANVQRYPMFQRGVGITAAVTGRLATAVTAAPHGRVTGNTVTIADAVQTQYNGLVAVFDVPSTTSFRYLIIGAPVTPATGVITYTPTGGGPLSVTSVVSSFDVVTLNAASHDFNLGQEVFVAGAAVAAYNGLQTPFAMTADTLQYLVPLATTTPTTGDITLSASASMLGFDEARPYFAANRNEPYLLIYRTSLGVVDEQPLYFVQPRDFEGYFNRASFGNSKGRPVYYTVLPNRRIAVFPFPDVGYTARVRYRRRVQLMAVDIEEPEVMPEEFHPMIAYKAVMDMTGFNENSRQFENASRLYEEMWEDLCIQQLPRISSVFGAVR